MMKEPKYSNVKSSDTRNDSRNHAISSLSYHHVQNAKVLPQYTSSKFSAKLADPVLEIKANFVTSYKNVEANSPHISEVTKKLTKSNKNHRKLSCEASLFICFTLVYFATYTFILQMKIHEITELERILLNTTDQTHKLTKIVADLKRNYRRRMDDVSSKLQNDLNSPRKKSKRSVEDISSWDQIGSRETVAVQFSGSKPFGFSAVPSEGILGPWAESTNDFNVIEEFGAHLKDGNSTLEIIRDGWYMIYAQVTYVSYVNSNSYSVQVIPNADKAHVQTITTCSSSGKITKIGEISCYTSAIKKLHAGDVVYIQQAQPNREIVFSKAYTHFGFVFLF